MKEKNRRNNIGIYILVLLLMVSGMVQAQSQKENSKNGVTASMVLEEAEKHLGKPYRWGGKGPNSFDCAGFVRYVYGKMGIPLGSSCVPQYAAGMPLTRGELMAGDLVFFGGRSSSRSIGHVGIVTSIDPEDGSFEFIHAARTGVRYSNSKERYYAVRYICACRILSPYAHPSYTMPDSIALDRYFDEDMKIYALMCGEDITDRLDARLVELDTADIPMDTVSLAFVGKLMMRDMNIWGKVKNLSMPYDENQRVKDADLSVGVLDGVIGKCDKWFKRRFNKKYKHQMLPESAMQMLYSGLDLISLSGDHCLDLGVDGYYETRKYLDSVGISCAGGLIDSMTTVVERNGYWYGYCSLRYDEQYMNESLKQAKTIIQSMRDTVDVMIVNFVPTRKCALGDSVMYNQRMERYARSCVNYGADVVVGCGEMGKEYAELVNDRVIVYGVGDFCKKGIMTSPVARLRVLSDGTFVEGQWYELPMDGSKMGESYKKMTPKRVGGSKLDRQ